MRKAVHPHACGEYASTIVRNGAMAGSPPRVWGIHEAVGASVEFRRFTPTRVGNTMA